MNQHQEYVAYVFKQAFARGLVKNRTEFARELNVAPSTISHIINGDKKWVGKTVERNAKLWAEAHGIEPDEAENEREKAEMKTRKGYQSDSQKQWQADVEKQGYRYAVCRSLDDFIDTVNAYLRG